MDKIHEIAGDGALMPRFDDGMVNMAELIRVMAESLVNEIMDARADEAREGGNRRNGYRERKLATGVGAINLRIPKPRAGSYFPEGLIERYSRVDRAVIAAVSEMVASGASAGKVRRVAQAMGIDRMSASRVSRMCSSLDESVADLRKRGLSDVTCPYIRLDATHIKRGGAGRVRSTALVTAIGAGSGGCRRLPGLDAVGTESHGGRRPFPLSPRTRGRRRDLRRRRRPRGPQARDPGGLPGRRVAAPHRASDAQRRRQRADQAEKGRRAGHPEGRVRRARPRAREGALPTRRRPDRGLLPQGGRGVCFVK